MSWAKIDDRLFLHPKFLQLSVEAQAVWLRMLSYAAGLERDGWFPDAALTVLNSALNVDAIVVELLRANLWIRDGDGYRFHDYLKYNPSRKQLIRQRKQAAKRVRALRTRNAVTSPLVTRLPARPGPTRPDLPLFAIAQRERARKAHRVPDTETLTEARRADALRLGVPAEHLDAVWAEFCDVEFKTARSDWNATWRNSCRRAVAHGFGAGHREAKSWQEREDEYQARKVAATIAELKAERGES